MARWAPIDGCDYEVSDEGAVRRAFDQRPIVASPGWSGYPTVYPTVQGKSKAIAVHRAVARAFVPNPHEKPHVNHIDGNKLNACAENLEWVTNAENAAHARKHGLSSPPPPSGPGVRSPAAKLTQFQADDIRLRAARGEKQRVIAARYGITQSAVSFIVRGISYPTEAA